MTMDNVVGTIRICKPILYKHFKSKEEPIGETLICWRRRQINSGCRSNSPASKHLEPLLHAGLLAIDLEHLGFEERFGLLVEHEMSERDGKALYQRLLACL